MREAHEAESDPDQSPHVDRWTDPTRREHYQYWAREKYEFFKASRDVTFKAHIEYGKWLLASGLAVHGGALYALNALKDPARPGLNEALVQAAQWNVAGLFSILVAGFLAWLNFGYAASIYDDWANPSMLYRTDEIRSEELKRDPVGTTRFLSICCGIIALWALLASASIVFSALRLR